MNEIFRHKIGWPYHVSSGTVSFNKDGSKIAILYRGKERFGRESWHLPKGTLNNNESLEDCAVRETLEEAGINVSLEGYLGSIQQEWVSRGSGLPINKATHYFYAKSLGSKNEMDDEHDEILWMEPEEAKKKLSLEPKKEEEIIDRALEFRRKFLSTK